MSLLRVDDSSDTKSCKEIMPHSIVYDMGICNQLPSNTSYYTRFQAILKVVAKSGQGNVPYRGCPATKK